MRRGIIVVLVALAASLLGGCSSGPSVKTFLAKADPICKQANDLVSVITIPSDFAGFSDFGTKMAEQTTKTVTQLEALKTPHGKKGDGAKAFIAGLKAGAGQARALAAKVASNDFPGLETAAAGLQSTFKDADSKARAYGSTQCGQAHADQATKAAQAAPSAAKKAFIAKADPICAAANAKLKALPDPNTAAELKADLDQTIDIVTKATADLKAIPPPAIDKATLDSWFAENDKAIDLGKQVSTAAAQNNGSKVDDLLNQLDAQNTTVNSKADAYGFKDCGSQGA